MLSRVAERVYWASRYLERTQGTARLISSHQALLFDLPSNVELDWYNLIIINDLESAFGERYTNKTERNVIKFLLGDDDNLSSLVNSIRGVKENVRTTRDVVPEEAWEMICELSAYAQDNLEKGLTRKGRFEYLEEIIKGCLQIDGLLFNIMPQDAAWEFLSIGKNLERADMTSRHLEAGVTAIRGLLDDENAVNSQQIIWGGVLRALSATQYYLRSTRTPVKGVEVVPFLSCDPVFPKSIAHCIHAICQSCETLPNGEAVVKKLRSIETEVKREIAYDPADDSLPAHLDHIQKRLNSIHSLIADKWFPAD